MVEPVSTTAAAVAAPAAVAATPAAASATGGGTAAASPGASGIGANSPAYGMKAQGSPMDSIAAQPGTGLDTSSVQRTLGCHDGSNAIPRSDSSQTADHMPNIADHWFNGPGQHGQVQFPKIEQPGSHAMAQPDPLPGKTARESSALDRAQSSSRLVETADPVGPRPEQRATTSPETQRGQPDASRVANTPETARAEPSAQDFAQRAEPSAPAKAAEHPAEPTPEDAATAPEPSRVPDRNLRSTQEDFERTDELAPMLGSEAEAFYLGTVSGFFGIFVEGLADFGDLMFDNFSTQAHKPGARDGWGKARRDFRAFSEETGRAALDRDEAFGTAGMVMGGLGPDAVSPSSKARVAGAGGTLVKKAAETRIKRQVVKKTLKKTAKAVVENAAAYKKLAKEGKLWTKPVSNSLGSWFQKWVTKLDYEYVGKLKKGKKTVQIDDLAIAADGKLVLVEVKFMKKSTDIADSGHVKFADEKVEHLERLVQYMKENRDSVSHIEITVSREEAAQIYAELVSSSPKLANYIGTIIQFGMP